MAVCSDKVAVRSWGIALLVIVVAGAICGATQLVEVGLYGFSAVELSSLFFTITLTAVVVERAVEVIVNVACEPRRSALSRPIMKAQRALEVAEQRLTREELRQASAGAVSSGTRVGERQRQVAAKENVLERAVKVQGRALTTHREYTKAWADRAGCVAESGGGRGGRAYTGPVRIYRR